MRADRLCAGPASRRILEHHLEVAPRFAQLALRQRVQVAAQNSTRPVLGGSSAIAMRASVDLPEPDSPTTPRLRPAAAYSSRLQRIDVRRA